MSRNHTNRDLVVAALRHAAPYIRMYKHKTFVIKAGGEAFVDPAQARAFLEQIAILHQVGIRVVLVHGAGPQSTARAREQGLETTLIQGRRVTDAATLAVSEAVNKEVRQLIEAIFADLGVTAKGFIGADGPVRAVRRPPVEMGEAGLVDFGFVGDIECVDTTMIEACLDSGAVPVISPLGADSAGTVLNINADTIAASLASALQAEKLILATGALGIFENLSDPGSLISYTDLQGLQRLRDNGSLADGMLPKARAIELAVEGGVPRVHVISFAVPDGLLLEIFTNEGTGTLIVRSITALTSEELTAEHGNSG